jgi:general stress protein YciG
MVLTVKSEERRKMTREEAGRKGGEKVAEERGSEFYKEIGRKGGERRGNKRAGTKGSRRQSGKADRKKNMNRRINHLFLSYWLVFVYNFPKCLFFKLNILR